MSEKIKKYRIYIFEVLFFAALLAVDLISKAAAFAFLEKKGGSYVVFEGIYELIEVHNDGASFGIFGGQTTMLSIFTAIAMVALVGMLIWRPKSPKLFRYGVIAVVAGGVGNLIDRLAYGYVRDFIDYTFLKTFFGIQNFGVGNIADIFVLVGLLCLMVYVFFGYKEGDFDKNPSLSGKIPETVVVNEGEEQKPVKQEEEKGLTQSSDAISENRGSDDFAREDSEKTISEEDNITRETGLSNTENNVAEKVVCVRRKINSEIETDEKSCVELKKSATKNNARGDAVKGGADR